MGLKTANDMVLEAQKVFDDLRSGAVKHKEAAEMVNAIGKMIGLSKIQLEYAHLRQERPSIPFLAGSTEGTGIKGITRHLIGDEEPAKKS